MGTGRQEWVKDRIRVICERVIDVYTGDGILKMKQMYSPTYDKFVTLYHLPKFSS